MEDFTTVKEKKQLHGYKPFSVLSFTSLFALLPCHIEFDEILNEITMHSFIVCYFLGYNARHMLLGNSVHRVLSL
jgi:hypothetical protein